ncbi:MAG: DUF4363 family protein [Oscillospiraceae bacterium]|nr:DUF4363 family protein [Oscillospiraceae bacterium]
MKVFFITMALFAAVITVTIVHINIVNSFQSSGIEILRSLDTAVTAENFEQASSELDNFETLYQSRRRWFSVILDTADLDKIEAHIAKMRRFLQLGAITEFYGEFIELYEIIDSLPYAEGIHLEVLF